MALVVVACILVLCAGAAGIFLQFAEARQDAAEAAAIFDGAEFIGSGDSVLIKQGVIWKGSPAFFTEPFETVVFVFRNGSWVSFTTQHAEAIDCPISLMVEAIIKSGRRIEDITHCVHNHFTPRGFTSGDMDARHYLARKGFAGVFGIYYPASERFKEWED